MNHRNPFERPVHAIAIDALMDSATLVVAALVVLRVAQTILA